MDPIEVRQVKEIILVSDDVHASRRLYREILGLAMPATPDRLNLARVGLQYLGAAQAGVMGHPGFYRPSPSRSRDRRRRLRTRRRPPAAAGYRGHHPSSAAGVHGHARERGRLLPRSRREPDRALGSAAHGGALTLRNDASEDGARAPVLRGACAADSKRKVSVGRRPDMTCGRTRSQVGPEGGWVRVAFSVAGPRNHERRGVSGRRSR